MQKSSFNITARRIWWDFIFAKGLRSETPWLVRSWLCRGRRYIGVSCEMIYPGMARFRSRSANLHTLSRGGSADRALETTATRRDSGADCLIRSRPAAGTRKHINQRINYSIGFDTNLTLRNTIQRTHFSALSNLTLPNDEILS